MFESRNFRSFGRIGFMIGYCCLLLCVEPPAWGQQRSSNPRFSRPMPRSTHSTRGRTQPTHRRVYVPRPGSHPQEQPGEPTPANQRLMESDPLALDRARQALLHNAAQRGGTAPIPTYFRPQNTRLASQETSPPPSASAPPSSAPSPAQTLPGTPPTAASPPFRQFDLPNEMAVDAPSHAPEYIHEDSPEYLDSEWIPTDDTDGCYEGDDCCYEDPCGPYEFNCFESCGNWCSSVFCQGNTQLGLGVAGFKGPANQGRDGSFGFFETVNFGSPLPFLPESGIGWQVGVRTIQSNFNSGSFSGEERNQTFFTSGFFHRCPVGLQAGFVFDMLKDKWYSDINLGQVRAEFSWKFPHTHEWGYWFALSDSTDTTFSPIGTNVQQSWSPTDLHAFFYRRRFRSCPGGTGRFFAGFTGDSDGLVGADVALPVNGCWSIKSGFTYLAPADSRSSDRALNEGWNVSVCLVWTLGGHVPNPFTPLLDVADNGSFFIDRVSP